MTIPLVANIEAWGYWRSRRLIRRLVALPLCSLTVSG
jgi:hypothetical protein